MWKAWVAGAALLAPVGVAACSGADRDFGDARGGASGASDAGEGATLSDGGQAPSAGTRSIGGAGSAGGAATPSGGGEGGKPMEEACAPDTYDCNEDPNDGCEATEAPALKTPSIRGPLRGAYTGSLHAPAEAATLRPIVSYSTQAGGCGTLRYEVQFDDSCEPGALTDCAFESVEHEGSSTESTYQPDTDLPVSTTAPVGALYAWRVRACDASKLCSDWSAPAHLNVGRTLQDLNGDGYADIIAQSAKGTEVYLGGANFNGQPDARLPVSTNPRFIGDVNGDGFADVGGMIGGWEPCTASGMVINVMYGDGKLTAVDTQTICRTAGSPSVTLAATDVGDMNGDGFDDLGVAWGFGSTENSYMVFGGGATVESEPLAEAPVATTDISYALTVNYNQVISGRGNYDGDTYADVVAAGWGTNKTAARLYVLTGAPKVASTFAQTVPDAACYSVLWLTNAGDINDDGLDDWALVCSGVNTDSRRFGVLLGGTPSTGALGLVWTTPVEIQSATPFLDFNGDGARELLIGISDHTAAIWQPGVSDPQAPAYYARYQAATRVDVADHNGDARLDVVFGAAQGAYRAGASTSFNVVATQLAIASDLESIVLAF